MTLYDVTIVGAGPAGSGAAREAAKKGLKTLLLEKDRMPRNKLCGGGVTPKVLKALDFNLPKEIVECEVNSVRVHTDKQDYHFETDHPITYMTSRSELDMFLAQKAVEAGAELSDGNPVYRIDTTDSYLEIKTKDRLIRTKMLIGADGMGGFTARETKLFERWLPNQVAYAIESEVYVGETGVEEYIGPERYFDLYFGASSPGYGWVFPKRDHLTVGIGCRLDRLRNARDLFNGFVKRIPTLEHVEIPKPQAHLIPIGGASKVPLVKPRVLLVGDSAGFAEPLLGEGIYFSIVSGQIAADVALKACSEDQFGLKFLTQYEKQCQKAFLEDFAVAYKLARICYLDQYDMDRVTRFFLGERRAQECMIGLMEGTLRYKDAQRRMAFPFLKYQLARLGFPFYS